MNEKIVMPTNQALVNGLHEKLVQYKARVINPKKSERARNDAELKAFVLEALIAKGTLDLEFTAQFAAEQLGDKFTPEGFKQAWDVIDDYCQTGGQNCDKQIV